MHAYLIMAHNNFKTLQYLLKLIDDERNDIYLHIDSKTGCVNINGIKDIVSKSSIHIFHSINVVWGECSQVDCEMLLMSEACKTSEYEFVHLISGVDLPIQSQDAIHSFFDKHKDTIFLHTATSNEVENELFKLNSYHFEKDTSYKRIKKFIYEFLGRRIFHYNRLFWMRNKTIAKSANWFSMPGYCVKYIVGKKKFVYKLTRHTLCADEFFAATVLINSKYWNLLYKKEDTQGHMRYIDWKNGNGHSPKTLGMEDYKKIIDSGMLWARKFDENYDTEVIESVYKFVKGT